MGVTVGNKSRHFNVQDYGADPTGTNDSNSAIVAASAAAAAADADGAGAVYFPTGKYLTSATLVVPQYQRWYGDNRESSIIKGTDAIAAGSAVVAYEGDTFFRDLRIEGNAASSATPCDVVHDKATHDGAALPVTRVTFENVYLNYGERGLVLTHTIIGRFVNMYIRRCTIGVYATDTNGATNNINHFEGGEIQLNDYGVQTDGNVSKMIFQSVTIEGNNNKGIWGNNAKAMSNLTIRDCWFELNGTHHVHLNNNCHMAMIESNSFRDGSQSIELQPPSGWRNTGTRIINNYFGDAAFAEPIQIRTRTDDCYMYGNKYGAQTGGKYQICPYLDEGNYTRFEGEHQEFDNDISAGGAIIYEGQRLSGTLGTNVLSSITTHSTTPNGAMFTIRWRSLSSGPISSANNIVLNSDGPYTPDIHDTITFLYWDGTWREMYRSNV